MTFVDDRIVLARNLAVNQLNGVSVFNICGDIVDLGAFPAGYQTGALASNANQAAALEDMFLCIDLVEALASSATTLLVLGVSGLSTPPTGVMTTDAVSLFSSDQRIFQYGNIDAAGSGVPIEYGFGTATQVGRILTQRLGSIGFAGSYRWLGLWAAQSNLGSGGTRLFTAGKINAYLTPNPYYGRIPAQALC